MPHGVAGQQTGLMLSRAGFLLASRGPSGEELLWPSQAPLSPPGSVGISSGCGHPLPDLFLPWVLCSGRGCLFMCALLVFSRGFFCLLVCFYALVAYPWLPVNNFPLGTDFGVFPLSYACTHAHIHTYTHI